jgi:hypothetical protein
VGELRGVLLDLDYGTAADVAARKELTRMGYVKSLDQKTLGELIDLLKRRDPDEKVRYDFGPFCPTTLDSYRGYYDDLALGFDEIDWDTYPTVKSLVAELESAIGKTFTGWKGGDYVMDRETPLWVANPGDSHGTAITGLAECRWITVLTTAYID